MTQEQKLNDLAGELMEEYGIDVETLPPTPGEQGKRETMREDYLEALDKMFPDGYLIVYTCEDSQLRMSLYNPHKDEMIERYHQTLKDEK